ncbi:uncharacterized protein C20orf204-like [Acipenser ruthenus]|uniref:uncharacterized protein C20orf204-like n=1 Tax=Acipenser ruthenus TaxID=7906 RepID=UPI00145C17D2|nr:uncharacterized protein C20orf204-like [Acipenser ruthenus]
MFVPRPAICIFLLVTALYPQSSDSKSKCNISQILKDYKVVIFQDIKSLNLTGLEYSNKNRNLGKSCQSDKEYKILQSIYKMTLLLKCQNSNKTNGIIEAVHKTTMQIESAINQHCKKMKKKSQQEDSRCTQKNLKSQSSIRRFKKDLSKTIETLVLCWAKLDTMHPQH